MKPTVIYPGAPKGEPFAGRAIDISEPDDNEVVAVIGRVSHTDNSRKAARDNLYFDDPALSAQHALIYDLNELEHNIYLKDTSLRGIAVWKSEEYRLWISKPGEWLELSTCDLIGLAPRKDKAVTANLTPEDAFKWFLVNCKVYLGIAISDRYSDMLWMIRLNKDALALSSKQQINSKENVRTQVMNLLSIRYDETNSSLSKSDDAFFNSFTECCMETMGDFLSNGFDDLEMIRWELDTQEQESDLSDVEWTIFDSDSEDIEPVRKRANEDEENELEPPKKVGKDYGALKAGAIGMMAGAIGMFGLLASVDV